MTFHWFKIKWYLKDNVLKKCFQISTHLLWGNPESKIINQITVRKYAAMANGCRAVEI